MNLFTLCEYCAINFSQFHFKVFLWAIMEGWENIMHFYAYVGFLLVFSVGVFHNHNPSNLLLHALTWHTLDTKSLLLIVLSVVLFLFIKICIDTSASYKSILLT